MNKQEQKFLNALEERFYKVGKYIDGSVFDPYVYVKEGVGAVEAINLTLEEARKLVHQARTKTPVQYYHIFNRENRWVADHDRPRTRNIRHLIK